VSSDLGFSIGKYAAAGVLAAVEVYLVWWEIKMDDRGTIKAQRPQEAGRILARLKKVLPLDFVQLDARNEG
jgi:hypothetical protein